MTLEQEIRKLSGIDTIGHALMDFVVAIHPGGSFVQEERSWVYRPDNFVVFYVHFQRANNITLSLRGAPHEFDQHSCLALDYGMGRV